MSKTIPKPEAECPRVSMIHALHELEGWRKRIAAEYGLTPEQIAGVIDAFSAMQEALDVEDDDDD